MLLVLRKLRGVVFAIAALATAAAGPRPFSPAERASVVDFLARTDGAASERAALQDDAALRTALLQRARVELGQRLRPSSVDRRWAIQPPQRNVEAEFEAAQGEGRLATWLAQLSPSAPDYARLREFRRSYAVIAGRGGWEPLPAWPKLQAGDRHDQVSALRQRLAAEGYGNSPAPDPQLFDPALRQALLAFQRTHGLLEDGVLGPATRSALNVPVTERLDQLDANLERWRWLPRAMPADRFEVDVGGASATLYRAGEPILEMKAVVGDRRHHTPMFASRIEAVIFNPAWNVPGSIAAKEILPRVRREPGYLARNGFTLQGGRLQQKPGEKNALGVLKFDLPSPFGVYLHDTPSKTGFARSDRALSHGCMRLEKPRELAVLLLRPQGGSAETVEAAIRAGRTSRVQLKSPMPLYVVYRTVTVGRTGEAVFRPDPYGWDSKLTAALRSASPRDPAQAPASASDCSE